MGNYKYELQSMSLTFEHNMVAHFPPILEHLSPILSHLTGLEVYDTIYLLVFISVIFSILTFYLIIKKFNLYVAILSLPFMILLITRKFYTGITWGQFDFYMGTLFLIAFVWCLTELKLKKIYLLLGLFLAASFLSHVVEAIWAIGFLVFYLLIKVLIKQFNLRHLKKLALSFILFFVIILYYFPIFMYLWFPGRKGEVFRLTSFRHYTPGGSYPSILFREFGILMIFLIIGIILSLLLLRKQKRNTALIFAIFIFLMSFTMYIGFDKAQQLRFLWPLYLSIFFGLAIYYLGKLLIKKWKITYIVILFTILSILFIKVYYEKINTPGIMNQYNWDALMWLKENTPEKSKVFYLYSDAYSQLATVYNSLRVSYRCQYDDYFNNMKEGKIKRYYYTLPIASIPYDIKIITVRTSFFTFKDYPRKGNFTEKGLLQDICDFDYYVIDKITRQPTIAQYNILIANLLLKNDWMEIVFNNEVSVIIKNNKPGVDCIVEQRITQ